MEQALVTTAKKLASCRALTVLTGAGVSKESGIPTFRDAQDGLWARYDPMELATREGFRANPELVWKWYTFRRGLVEKANPNPGHLALVEIERRVTTFSLITQNVDGLHQRAGSGQVHELHGNINRNKCFDEDRVVETWDESTVPPKCSCGSYIRPDVVWFGESLPQAVISEAYRVSRSCDTMLVVGTSGLVQPAALLPFEALDAGAWVVEINPDPTPLTDHAHLHLPGKSGTILRQIADLLEEF